MYQNFCVEMSLSFQKELLFLGLDFLIKKFWGKNSRYLQNKTQKLLKVEVTDSLPPHSVVSHISSPFKQEGFHTAVAVCE